MEAVLSIRNRCNRPKLPRPNTLASHRQPAMLRTSQTLVVRILALKVLLAGVVRRIRLCTALLGRASMKDLQQLLIAIIITGITRVTRSIKASTAL